MTVEFWYIMASCLCPAGFVVALVEYRAWIISRQNKRAPVAEKLLRSPGQSTRNVISDLDGEIYQWLAVTFVAPVLYVGCLLAQRSKIRGSPGTDAIFGIIALVAFGYFCRKILTLRERRRRYRLGLSGELAVGEQLNQLMREGCFVFHDVPNDPYGNIDHVVVAPTGVFAVETKTRRKWGNHGQAAHIATYDGNSIRFGHGSADSRPLDQAKQQARRLSVMLFKSVQIPVEAVPVVALPGYCVERTGPGDVIVLAGSSMDWLLKGKRQFDEESMKMFAHQLDQRCRDVEF